MPILELPDSMIIIESKIIMLFAEEVSTSGSPLLPACPKLKAQLRLT